MYSKKIPLLGIFQRLTDLFLSCPVSIKPILTRFLSRSEIFSFICELYKVILTFLRMTPSKNEKTIPIWNYKQLGFRENGLC